MVLGIRKPPKSSLKFSEVFTSGQTTIVWLKKGYVSPIYPNITYHYRITMNWVPSDLSAALCARPELAASRSASHGNVGALGFILHFMEILLNFWNWLRMFEKNWKTLKTLILTQKMETVESVCQHTSWWYATCRRVVQRGREVNILQWNAMLNLVELEERLIPKGLRCQVCITSVSTHLHVYTWRMKHMKMQRCDLCATLIYLLPNDHLGVA